MTEFLALVGVLTLAAIIFLSAVKVVDNVIRLNELTPAVDRLEKEVIDLKNYHAERSDQ